MSVLLEVRINYLYETNSHLYRYVSLGGCFDEEFAVDSKRFFEFVTKQKHILLVSEMVEAEILSAPEQVQAVLRTFSREQVEVLAYTEEVEALSNAYIQANVLMKSSMNDAIHVASATKGDADVIVSWNFRHLVNLVRIREFNAVNLRVGYKMIDIRSPKELIYEENI